MLEGLELRVLLLSGLELAKIDRRYMIIRMEGKPFRVRTIIYGAEEEGKKTLLMTHGFMGASAVWIYMLKHLAEKYRLVLFDHGSWGLNTRLDESAGMETPEAAENW